jgi:hypothetical protein
LNQILLFQPLPPSHPTTTSRFLLLLPFQSRYLRWKCSAHGRRDVSATVLRLVLHLEGQIEQAIQEIQSGLRNGEPEAELCRPAAL